MGFLVKFKNSMNFNIHSLKTLKFLSMKVIFIIRINSTFYFPFVNFIFMIIQS